MFEKVSMAHPDKVADRIAGALVDACLKHDPEARCAFEVQIGHGLCTITAETTDQRWEADVPAIVRRIAGTGFKIVLNSVPQDKKLASNEEHGLRAADNGIFVGCSPTSEEKALSHFARLLWKSHPTDGKFLISDLDLLVVCQSGPNDKKLKHDVYTAAKECGFGQSSLGGIVINPLGAWSGGPNVDTGATNRKLGSDLGRSATGGGIHGKDLTKPDVAVTIWLHLLALHTGRSFETSCAIGDDTVGNAPYANIVAAARRYVKKLGGFEKLAEWGLL